jgi:hypothetical protein
MKYYIYSIEQIIKNGELQEYATSEKVESEQLSISKYYKKLSDVAADIGKNHTFMEIRVFNSIGGNLKHDVIGKYLEQLPETEEKS